jgi:hypothetical protein
VPLPPQNAPPGRPGAPGKPGPPPSAEEAAKLRRHQTDELTDQAQKLEEELEALKARYEMYFLGVERLEPAKWRDDVKRKVLRVKSAFTRNTGLKFKIQSLHARYLSYERLWLRSAREREEGRYHRDLFKARLHAREKAAPPAAGARAATAAASAAAVAGAATPTVKGPVAPAARPAAPSAPRPPATPAPASGNDPQVRALYDAYVAAKKQCNEDVSRLTYDAVARTVAKQVPELMARFKAKSVDFKVEVKDGKAVLKAIPRV